MNKPVDYTATIESEIAGQGTINQVWQRVLYFIALTGIDLPLLLTMTVTLAALIVSTGGSIRWFQSGVLLPLFVMAILIGYDFVEWIYSKLMGHLYTAREFLSQIPIILRDWIAFLFIAFIYENLHDISSRIGAYSIADVLYRFDVGLFGTEPTIWAQKFCSPILTDIMSIFYALYLALPLALMFFLSLSNRRALFSRISIAVAFTFVMGFIGYVVFPCVPPRFYLEGFYSPPVLRGAFLHYHLQEIWDNLSVVKGAAFPSLHVGISTVALIYAYCFRNLSKLYKLIWYLYIPLVTGLWVSTIYLRHHWVGDIFAGWILALIAAILSEKSFRIRCRLRKRFGMPAAN